MTDFINDIELSVRAGNVLRNMGINNLDAFMALTKKEVMAEINAGNRTWNEIANLQKHFRCLAEERDQPALPAMQWSARDVMALNLLPKVMDTCAQDTREPGETHEQMFARKAYALADAMLAARETKEDDP